MQRVPLIASLVGLVTALTCDPVDGQPLVIYDATAGPLFEADQPFMLDDGDFRPQRRQLICDCADIVRFAFHVPVEMTDTTVFVQFWDTITRNNSPVNSVLLGGFNVTYNNLTMGDYFKTVRLRPNGIVFPDDDWAVEFKYTHPVDGTLNHDVEPIFSNAATVVGSNDGGVFWTDTEGNNDGIFDDPGDARSFVQARAQVYLKLECVPEPSAIAPLLAVGALAATRRRQRR